MFFKWYSHTHNMRWPYYMFNHTWWFFTMHYTGCVSMQVTGNVTWIYYIWLLFETCITCDGFHTCIMRYGPITWFDDVHWFSNLKDDVGGAKVHRTSVTSWYFQCFIINLRHLWGDLTNICAKPSIVMQSLFLCMWTHRLRGQRGWCKSTSKTLYF